MRAVFFCFLTFLTISLHSQKASRLPAYINSEAEEREPILSPDGRTLYFWRRVSAENLGGKDDPGDIWYSKKDRSGRWMTAQQFPQPLNSKGHDFVWGVSPRHDTLWVHQVSPGVSDVGLAYSVKTPDGYWTSPREAYIRDFTYRGSYKDFYFTKDRIMILPNAGDDSYGGTDLYACFPINDTAWQRPINLGPVINTSGDDDAPFLSADGTKLYFNSNGHGGEGDHDVFVSRRLDNSWRNWSPPEPVGAPINTPGYDFDFIMSDDGKTAFWGSSTNSIGSNDLFQMDLSKCDVHIYPEGEQRMCEGTVAVLEAGFTPDEQVSYQWLKDGRLIPGLTTRSIRVKASGDYQVIRTRPGCKATSTVSQVRFVQPPGGDLVAGSDVICPNDSTSIRVVSAEATRFQWTKNNLEIPFTNQETYWVKTAGNYQVVMYNGGCRGVSRSINMRRFEAPVIQSGSSLSNDGPVIPRWNWTNKVPFEKGERFVQDIAAGPEGNAFVLTSTEKKGRFYDQVSVFSSNGLFQKSFEQENIGRRESRLLASDPEGNLLIAGNETYLIKYRADGKMLWKQDESRQNLVGLTTDPLGNVYAAGRFDEREIIQGKPLDAVSRGGLFLSKHAPDGRLVWAKNYGVDGEKYVFPDALHGDCAGNVYLAGGLDLIGNFEGSLVRASLREENYFLAKVGPAGKVKWTKKLVTPRSRRKLHAVHTDCEGRSIMYLNGQLLVIGAGGKTLWQGRLKRPDDSPVIAVRLNAAQGEFHIAALNEKGELFISKLNRIYNQIFIWRDRGAEATKVNVPALTSINGDLFISAMSKGNGFEGTQFDLTSRSTTFLMQYGPPDVILQRDALEICKGESLQLRTRPQAGMRYQWYRDGQPIAEATTTRLQVERAGSYQVMAISYDCQRLSQPQAVTQCGENTPSPVVSAKPDIIPVPPKPEPKPIIQNEPEEDVVPHSDLRTDNRGRPQKLRGRRIKTQEEIVIGSRRATVTVWDHAAEDRDTVSVSINGNWLVQEYGLRKRKKSFEVEFEPGTNYIILYAHNLGATPPNTASITVDDGVRKQSLQLRSNLRNCGMLTVRTPDD
ncbi:MAG: hypothetical protein AAF206_16515 [Bacteroidota bacterium]